MGCLLLLLRQAGLAFLANPKTASQAIIAMLKPHGERPELARGTPHMNSRTFANRLVPYLLVEYGQTFETVAVMREPLARLHSWFRYRQRDALIGKPNSTHGMTFDAFVAASLSDPTPPFASVGRQDRFLGFLGGGPPVTHIFDHAHLDLLVDFLSDRLGEPLDLTHRNISPGATEPPALPPDIAARYAQAHHDEIVLYARVADQGHLITR
jgi:hypothetical protein